LPWLLVLVSLLPSAARAHLPPRPPAAAGSLVSLSVEVEGRPAPLYAAADGSSRHYVEARQGREYALRLANRTGERVGVAITVDGLNVISGEREAAGPAPPRMYVLAPWAEVTVRGWRTSLEEVRRFTFVDEKRSYAVRSGKDNPRLGWIEVAVHRERVRRGVVEDAPVARERNRDADSAGAAAPRSHPGTGWGRPAGDPAVLVDFDAQGAPAERITVRYEYAWGLRALGIDPRPHADLDRLRARDRGDGGFAKPPAW
jgi:hypothetical protein